MKGESIPPKRVSQGAKARKRGAVHYHWRQGEIGKLNRKHQLDPMDLLTEDDSCNETAPIGDDQNEVHSLHPAGLDQEWPPADYNKLQRQHYNIGIDGQVVHLVADGQWGSFERLVDICGNQDVLASVLDASNHELGVVQGD